MPSLEADPTRWLRADLPDGSAAAHTLQGRSILAGETGLPCAVIRQSALRHNSTWMRGFLERTGVTLAPHVKTSMAPGLMQRQLADGLDWLTVATVQQARVAIAAGARQVLIANQVVNDHDIGWLAAHDGTALQIFCFVDSLDGVQRLARGLSGLARGAPLGVLIEIGVDGGRAGVRNGEQALALARAIAAEPTLTLVGLAGYEGVYSPRDPAALPKVDAYLQGIVDSARAIIAAGLFEGRYDEGRFWLSAGGSKFFDRVAAVFAPADPGRPTRAVIRPGCYLYHDEGIYEQAMQLMLERSPLARELGNLAPAMELWGQVQSRPEAGLAIVSIGRREASYDGGLPIPRLRARAGIDRVARPLTGAHTSRLNDQHAFVEIAPETELAVGDLIGFGISHPCTVFDKWRGVFIVDDDYRVVDFVETCFG